MWKGIRHIYEKSNFKSMRGNSLIDTIGITDYSTEEKKSQIRALSHNIYRLIPEGLKGQMKTIF